MQIPDHRFGTIVYSPGSNNFKFNYYAQLDDNYIPQEKKGSVAINVATTITFNNDGGEIDIVSLMFPIFTNLFFI